MKTIAWVFSDLFWLANSVHAQTVLSVVSAASGAAVVAPNSLASAFGTKLASGAIAANGLPLPTLLGGVSVTVTDSAGDSRLAGLLFVSPQQINFLVPPGTPAGSVTVTVAAGSDVVARGTVPVQAVAPALFAVPGTRIAAAIGVRRIAPNGPATSFPVFQCNSAGAQCAPVPIDLGVDTPVYLELYGTGIRGGSTAIVTIGGVPVQLLYAGAQPQFPGLDQVNVSVPLTLRGAGLADIVVTVDGQPSNRVQVTIR